MLAVGLLSLDNAVLMNPSELSLQSGALRGLQILDLSRVLAGPWATQLLGDFGANIVKVERPGSGDDTRQWGPPWLTGGTHREDASDAAYFLSANRNKRSITIDFSTPQGAALVRSLASRVDILVENFRVGKLADFGLDYESLKASNPRLIYCSISGYGQSGMRAGEPAYDAMIQAAGGLMSITGAADTEGGTPQKAGVAIADIMAGMYAVSAILAAVIARNENGEGQHIDVPLYDSQVAWLANQAMNYLIGGIAPERQGSAHPNLAPYQTFSTADGYLCVAIGTDEQFRRCMKCMELEHLANDECFRSNAGRVTHRKELIPPMAIKLREKTTAEWLQICAENSIPAGPVNSIDTVLSDDYAAEKGLVRYVRHSSEGEIPTVANPVNFSRTPVEYRFAPPSLGEHTDDILRQELGLSDDEIENLRKAKIV